MKACSRQIKKLPNACAMSNVYRFVEPVALYMLLENGPSHGYQLMAGMREHALTDAEIEGAALYRTLRRLEANGFVESSWDIQSRGPARRVYALTKAGKGHLREWGQMLDNLSRSMSSFVTKVRRTKAPRRAAKRAESKAGKK